MSFKTSVKRITLIKRLFLHFDRYIQCGSAHLYRRLCRNDQQALVLKDRGYGKQFPYIANISEAVARLLKPYGVGVAHRPAGTLRSRLMRIIDRVDPSEQSSIIYRAQCKHCYSN